MNHMNIKMMSKNIFALFAILALSSCSLSPGMHMSTSKKFSDNQEYVYIESLNSNILIKDITELDSENFTKVHTKLVMEIKFQSQYGACLKSFQFQILALIKI